nr:unnamed protein product [Digitaria exilis]
MSASPEDKAMAELVSTREEAGITEAEAARRLRLHGPNVVVRSRHEGGVLKKFLRGLFSLWGWDHVSPKYNSMVRIMLDSMSWVTVLIAAPLEAKVHAPRAKVLRDGRWRDVHADNLVPGDIIFLKVGDIVPANARVLRFQKIGTMTCWAKSRGTVALEDLASMDVILFDMTAAGASRSQHELYIEPIDAAILSLLDDPEQVAHQCGCSKADKEKISTMMDELALDGYQAIAVGHQVDSCWEFIGLLPYRDDLRCDVTDAVGGLIDLGLGVANGDVLR